MLHLSASKTVDQELKFWEQLSFDEEKMKKHNEFAKIDSRAVRFIPKMSWGSKWVSQWSKFLANKPKYVKVWEEFQQKNDADARLVQLRDAVGKERGALSLEAHLKVEMQTQKAVKEAQVAQMSHPLFQGAISPCHDIHGCHLPPVVVGLAFPSQTFVWVSRM